MDGSNSHYLCEDGVLFDHDKTTLILCPAQSDKTHLDIPPTVTTIMPAAFSGCKLKAITLPQALTRIGDGMLSGLTQLESVAIPSTVTEIGSSAFRGCTSLKEVEVPASVQSIGTAAFAESPSLTRVRLPDGLTRIEGWLFDGCSSLSEVNIPDGVDYIGMAAFQNCSSLPAVQIPQGVTIIDDYAFEGCCRFTEITIPDKVQVLHWDSFRGCTGLEKVSLGSSLTEMHAGSFYGCDNIQQVWSNIKEPFDVTAYDYIQGGIALVGRCFPEAVTRQAVLYVPEGTGVKYKSKAGWRDFLNIQEKTQSSVEVFRSEDSNAIFPFDLQGRHLNSQPTKGIYIIKGRKVVVR